MAVGTRACAGCSRCGVSEGRAAAADIWPKLPPVKVAEFLLHVLRLRGRMEEEEEEEVVMEFTDSEPDV